MEKLGGAGVDAATAVDTLKHALGSANGMILSKAFRERALGLIAQSLAGAFGDEGAPAAARRNAACALVLCRQLLGDADAVGEIVVRLLDAGEEGEDDAALLGLQLCFDIVDSGDQAFVAKVAACLPQKGEAAVVEGSNGAAGGNVEVGADGTAAASSAATEQGVEVETQPRSDAAWERFARARRVLTGGFTSELALSFLYKNSNSDPLIMANLKKALEERTASRNSALHNCAVTAHGYLNAGTTNDAFLRDNLDWMKKASNW